MIQIDMQMPERCGACFAMHADEIGLVLWCGIDETARDLNTEEINKKRPDWCPLKEQCEVKPKSKSRKGEYPQIVHRCGNCNEVLYRYYKYCPSCGRAVKWE